MNVVDIINKAISERRTRFAFELLPPLKGDVIAHMFFCRLFCFFCCS